MCAIYGSVGLGVLRRSDAGCEQQSCKRAGEPDEYHDESPSSGHNGRASAPPLDAAAEQRFPGFLPQRCRALIPLQSCGNRVFERRSLCIQSMLLRLHLAHCVDRLGCCPRRENPMRRRIFNGWLVTVGCRRNCSRTLGRSPKVSAGEPGLVLSLIPHALLARSEPTQGPHQGPRSFSNRFSTAAVMRAQRAPAKGNAPFKLDAS